MLHLQSITFFLDRENMSAHDEKERTRQPEETREDK